MADELQWRRAEPLICQHHYGRVFRNADDQNDVVILQDVTDVAKARAWLGSTEIKTAMEKSGVVGSPSIRFAAAA